MARLYLAASKDVIEAAQMLRNQEDELWDLVRKKTIPDNAVWARMKDLQHFRRGELVLAARRYMGIRQHPDLTLRYKRFTVKNPEDRYG